MDNFQVCLVLDEIYGFTKGKKECLIFPFQSSWMLTAPAHPGDRKWYTASLLVLSADEVVSFLRDQGSDLDPAASIQINLETCIVGAALEKKVALAGSLVAGLQFPEGMKVHRKKSLLGFKELAADKTHLLIFS